MNARADTTINIITWIAVVLIVLIVFFWFFGKFGFTKPKIELIKSDLINLREMIDESCDTNAYFWGFNPVVEQGTLTLQDSNICAQAFDLRMCEQSICSTGLSMSIDLGAINTLYVQKDNATNNRVEVHGQ